MSIQDNYFAASLSFSMPQQTKKDTTAEAMVEEANNASDTIIASRRLYSRDSLAPFLSCQSAARSYLHRKTTQVGDSLLLHKKLLFPVTKEIEGNFLAQWAQARVAFGQDYGRILQKASDAQGDLYDPSVYPDVSVVVSQFTASFDIHPVGGIAKNMFVGMEKQEEQEITARLEASMHKDLVSASEAALMRLVTAVMNIHDKTKREGSRVHDAIVNELEEVTGLMSALNVAEIPQITALAKKCRDTLLVSADELRGESATQRDRVAQESGAILQALQIDPDLSGGTNKHRKDNAKQAVSSILQQMGAFT